MDPDTNENEEFYRRIIAQLHYDGHSQLALDIAIRLQFRGMNLCPPPSDNLFRLDSATLQNADNAEEKEVDMQTSLSPVVSSIENLTIDEECRDYFPILALPKHILDLIFSFLSIENRLALAGVNRELNKIESESKYYVEQLAIVEIPFNCAPFTNNYEHYIILFENKFYSSDFIRRIAHNASIGRLYIYLCGSSEFHREVCNIIKEINISTLQLSFKNPEFGKEVMVESFVLGLAKSCHTLIMILDYATPDTRRKLYEFMSNGNEKLRALITYLGKTNFFSFLNLIGITYMDGTFFSNKEIEVYKMDYDDELNDRAESDHFHVFDGQLRMCFKLYESKNYVKLELFNIEYRKSFDDSNRDEGGRKIDVLPE